MNLNHRMGEGKGLGRISGVLYKIEYPVNVIIPIVILFISWLEVKKYFGQVWQTGPFSTNIVPRLAEMISGLFNTPKDMVISDLVLWGIVFGNGTLYLLVKSITNRHLPAIIAALFFNLPIFIFSTTCAERLVLALNQNDGAHILGLTFTPLVWLVFLKYSRSGQKSFLITFFLLLILVAIISFFSVFTMLIGMVFIAISEAFVGFIRSIFLRFLICTGGTIVIISAIYNTKIMSMFSAPEGQAAIISFINLIPLSFFIFPVFGTFCFLIFDRRPKLQPVFVSFGLSVFFGLMHLVRTNLVDIVLVDNGRFGAELTLALSFFWGMVILWIFELVRSGKLLTKNLLMQKYHNQISYIFISTIFIIIVGVYFFISRNLG